MDLNLEKFAVSQRTKYVYKRTMMFVIFVIAISAHGLDLFSGSHLGCVSLRQKYLSRVRFLRQSVTLQTKWVK